MDISVSNPARSYVRVLTRDEASAAIDKIKNAIDEIEITKDRYKKEDVNGIELINHLAKGQNPVACSIVFKYVKEEKKNKEIVLLIEDYHDNKESSENMAWIYDCDFEFLNDESIKKIIVPGERAKDIKLRLLIAGVKEDRIAALENENDVINELSLNFQIKQIN